MENIVQSWLRHCTTPITDCQHPQSTIIIIGSLFLKRCATVLFCSVLFCSVLFCSVLFCSVLFCSVLFCSVLFCSVLFCSVLFCSVLFCSVLFCSVLFCSVLFCSVLFCSVLFCSVMFCSVLFCSVRLCDSCVEERQCWRYKPWLNDLYYFSVGQIFPQQTLANNVNGVGKHFRCRYS